MHAFRIVNGLLLGVALTAPVVLRADDKNTTTTTTTQRYYDLDAKDYHEWTPQEIVLTASTWGKSIGTMLSSRKSKLPSRENTSSGAMATRIQ